MPQFTVHAVRPSPATCVVDAEDIEDAHMKLDLPEFSVFTVDGFEGEYMSRVWFSGIRRRGGVRPPGHTSPYSVDGLYRRWLAAYKDLGVPVPDDLKEWVEQWFADNMSDVASQ
jgi:hypothetical protein